MPTHPIYDAKIDDWTKYRYTIEGGRNFVDEYLERLSTREDDTDFTTRRDLSYCVAIAKSVIIEIKNSIYQRLIDISRTGGSIIYQEAVAGRDGGVDFCGNSMTSFIGTKVLLDLLAIGKIGVFVDKFPKVDGTKADNYGNRPYLYTYRAEDIMSWTKDTCGNFTRLYVRSYDYEKDDLGYPTDYIESYKSFELTEEGVLCRLFDSEEKEQSQTLLPIKEIPFFVFELSDSLLTDVADYQIAATNLASSDLSFALRANFPFYTEQYSPGADLADILKMDPEGTTSNDTVKNQSINVGTQHGRKYPKGTERPAFINPSTDPMRASMDKQESMKEEIRQLVNLAITNIDPKRASAESRAFDEKPLEAGLSYIGLELEYGERRLAHFWSIYDGSDEPTISYPQNYSLRNDADRRAESKDLLELSPKIPSKSFQRVIAKNVVETLYGTKLSKEALDKIKVEIDESAIVNIDPSLILQDHEAGLVSDKLASTLRGYPTGETEQAAKDHAARAARIALAQSSVSKGDRGIDNNMDARGVPDLGMKNAKDEKR
jgi:hypothetical protein